MIINPDNSWNNEEEVPQHQLDLSEQEQMNSNNLVERVEEEAISENPDIDEITTQPSSGEEDLSSFLERSTDADQSQPIGNDKPLTKNLLGDNPPGAEQAAFDAGNTGDASSAIFQYDAENLIEGFRENLDKTEQQINLDKKLKENSND
ncbi:MAG TPA: hypothetical protein VGB63_02565 [Pedobacter sp.]|jgi:hypothetical protein